jgi:hypothetical protein
MTERAAPADAGLQGKNRSQAYRGLSHEGKPKLNGPTHQAEQHFKDF